MDYYYNKAQIKQYELSALGHSVSSRWEREVSNSNRETEICFVLTPLLRSPSILYSGSPDLAFLSWSHSSSFLSNNRLLQAPITIM